MGVLLVRKNAVRLDCEPPQGLGGPIAISTHAKKTLVFVVMEQHLQVRKVPTTAVRLHATEQQVSFGAFASTPTVPLCSLAMVQCQVQALLPEQHPAADTGITGVLLPPRKMRSNQPTRHPWWHSPLDT